ncbi:MoaD/ThiS family protein [Polaromonas sp. SM01]|nr:MoaD/ThiS family protein [Polaromonas sp. SM01]MDW5443050.1 MoaD/ThiS family protein [Polaromonas sp. SM01]
MCRCRSRHTGSAAGVGAGLQGLQMACLAALRDELLASSPAHADSLARRKAVRMALNQVMSNESAALVEGCEVAFFPPVTGG